MHTTDTLKDIPMFKGLPEETLNQLEARTSTSASKTARST